MDEFLNKVTSYFYFDFRYKEPSRRFKKSLYILLLVNAIYWLWYYTLFFGPSSVIYHSSLHASGIKDLAFLLYHNPSEGAAAIYIVGVMVICAFMLWYKRDQPLLDAVLWILVLNIHNTLYATLTGGNFLLNQFLFFNCFLSFSSVSSTNRFASIKVFFHNLSVVAIIIQICLAYFLAALAKVADPLWLQGSALGSVLQIEHFSLYSMPGHQTGLAAVYLIFNYVILFYQLLFPVMVWLKPLKRPFLLFGIATHLYISLVMGLFMFGIIMIMGYVFFWPEKRP